MRAASVPELPDPAEHPGKAGLVGGGDQFMVAHCAAGLNYRERVRCRRPAGRGIVYVVRNGLQWKDAPRAYGPHKTLYNHFVRWSWLGVSANIFADWRRSRASPTG